MTPHIGLPHCPQLSQRPDTHWGAPTLLKRDPRPAGNRQLPSILAVCSVLEQWTGSSKLENQRQPSPLVKRCSTNAAQPGACFGAWQEAPAPPQGAAGGCQGRLAVRLEQDHFGSPASSPGNAASRPVAFCCEQRGGTDRQGR